MGQDISLFPVYRLRSRSSPAREEWNPSRGLQAAGEPSDSHLQPKPEKGGGYTYRRNMQADVETTAANLLPKVGLESDLQLVSPLRQARFYSLDDTVQVTGLRRITQSDAPVDAEPAQVDCPLQRFQQPPGGLHGEPQQAPRQGPLPWRGSARSGIGNRFRAQANRFFPATGCSPGSHWKGDASKGAPDNRWTPSPGAGTGNGDPNEPGEQGRLRPHRHRSTGKRPVDPHAQGDRDREQRQRGA